MRTKNAVALSRLYGKRDPRLLALQIPDATVRDHASGRREPGIRAARKYLEGLGLPLEGWLVAVERKKDDAAIAAARAVGT